MELGKDGSEDVAVVQLPKDDQGLAAGQFTAFYLGNTCLGSGIILESWDEQGFPVCERALEIARMVDKSLLGKPVKIKVKPEDPTPELDERGSTEASKRQKSSHIAAAKQGRQGLFFTKLLLQFREKWSRIF